MAVDPDMDVLIVDDASAMRRIVRGLLEGSRFDKHARCGKRSVGVGRTEKEKADFVVSDWNMPVMTGIELLKAIRAADGLMTTPALMVTAEAKQENIVEAVQAGLTITSPSRSTRRRSRSS